MSQDAQETMTQTNPDASPDTSRENGVESVYEWVGAAIFSLTFVVLVFTFLFRIVGVVGSSMNPTLYNGERLIIQRLGYTHVQRGDIVIVNRYVEEPLVKRVIAVGGDRLQIDDETGEVRINGEVIDEPYIQGITHSLGFGPLEQTVPEGCVFVMGDNRQRSKDSRYMDEVGFVDEEDLIGKAIFRFLPINKMGSVS